MRLDVRNNLTVVMRYFPQGWRWTYALDWMRRYRWIAQTKGWRHRIAFWRGIVEGTLRSSRPKQRRPLTAHAFEQFAMVLTIQQRMASAVRDHGHRSILLIDVGKNILPFWLAANACDVRIVAVADPRLAKPGRKYRGIPVVDDAAARLMHFDAAVVANVSPVHAALRRDDWRQMIQRPVIDLFETPEVLALVA
jgi:hypothetical protein